MIPLRSSQGKNPSGDSDQPHQSIFSPDHDSIISPDLTCKIGDVRGEIHTAALLLDAMTLLAPAPDMQKQGCEEFLICCGELPVKETLPCAAVSLRLQRCWRWRRNSSRMCG